MCEYVDGLVVHVEERAEGSPEREERPVAGVNIGVELEMARHVPPKEKLSWRRTAVGHLAIAAACRLLFVRHGDVTFARLPVARLRGRDRYAEAAIVDNPFSKVSA